MIIPKFKTFKIKAYKPGKSNIGKIKSIIKLSANESALGVSSKVKRILNNKDFIQGLSRNINLNKASKSLPPIPSIGSNTVYLTVVDRNLNSVSLEFHLNR